MGYLGSKSIEFAEDLPKVKKINMVDFRYKIPEELWYKLEQTSRDTGYHMNEICTIALEAFFRRKGKK